MDLSVVRPTHYKCHMQSHSTMPEMRFCWLGCVRGGRLLGAAHLNETIRHYFGVLLSVESFIFSYLYLIRLLPIMHIPDFVSYIVRFIESVFVSVDRSLDKYCTMCLHVLQLNCIKVECYLSE